MCVCRSAGYSTALPQLSADQPIKRHSHPRVRPLRQTAMSSPSPSVWRSKRMMGRARSGESPCFSPSVKVHSGLQIPPSTYPCLTAEVSSLTALSELGVIFCYPAFGSNQPCFDEGNDKNSKICGSSTSSSLSLKCRHMLPVVYHPLHLLLIPPPCTEFY